jgi:propanol-preferring alcohol dehydrogenase
VQAARIYEDLTVRVEETNIPELGPEQVLVRIEAAGVCGTDLHILDGMIRPDSYPMTLGHEAAGVIEAVGTAVAAQPGLRVALYNKIFCALCEQCLNGRQNLCEREIGQLGFTLDGGDAQYAILPERNLVELPDTVDSATAAVLTCAGMTAVHAARLSGLRLGETAVVNGIGGVGVMVTQTARAAGARVIAVGDSQTKLDLAFEHGATDGIVVEGPDGYDQLPDRLRSMTAGRGADVFFELVGTTRTMAAGIRSLAKRGRFVSTGYTAELITIHPIEFILPETSLISTVAGSKTDLEQAVQLAASGSLRVPVAARYPLNGVQEALDALRKRQVLGRQVLMIG